MNRVISKEEQAAAGQKSGVSEHKSDVSSQKGGVSEREKGVAEHNSGVSAQKGVAEHNSGVSAQKGVRSGKAGVGEDFFSVKALAVIALMAALCCVLGPFTVPIGPVPVSFVMIGIYLAVYALGMIRGSIAVIIYLLIGLVGVPVFSGFSGGAAKLFGPTGGYLIGYIFLALISGWFIDRFPLRKWYLHLVGMILGMAVCYLFGTAWFMILTKSGLWRSLTLCVIPFAPFDLVKIVLCYFLGSAIRVSLTRAGLMSYPVRD